MRDTPGRMLLAWGVLLSSLVVLSWRIHLHQADYDWLEFPTALGDRRYYDPGPTGETGKLVRNGPAQPLGENDFFDANLVFQTDGETRALYRRMHRPTPRDDARMRKVAVEQSGRFHVYTDARPQADNAARYYLKAAEDAFIEFGEKKFFPPYAPPEAAAPPAATATPAP